MRYIFKFPDIGEGITEGRILKWHVSKGERVRMGDPVVQMETDKVVADIPSPRDGVIAARFGQAGEIVKVEDPLVEIEIEGVAGVDARAVQREKPAGKSVKPVEETGFGVVGTLEVAGDAAFLPASEEGAAAVEKPVRPAKALATPVARAMARELGVEIGRVKGGGPGGRVMKEDIRKAYEKMQTGPAGTAAAAVPEEDAGPAVIYEPLTQIRKAIARNMSISKQTAAHMTLIEEVEISELAGLRKSQQESFKQRGLSLTYLPFILKAAALSLRNNPSMNARLELEQGRMALFRRINIGIAVDAPDGLVVPVIHDAGRRTIADLAETVQTLAAKARQRSLGLDDIKDGTFTVTNYGAIGGLFGVPVINYPQAAILGIGRIHQQPVVKDGQLAVGTVLPLSLSVDHRMVDGGTATRFINDVMRYLHDPVSMLLE